jgi:hypothetical protein
MSRVLQTLCFTAIILLATNVSGRVHKEVEDKLRIPDSNRIQIITTVGGSTIIGRIVEIGEGEVKFETELGIQKIPIVKIKEIKEAPTSSIRDGKYWFPNPNATRLYFAPTGRMLKQGQGYFSDYYLFFPGVAWGITDNFAFGVGMSLFPGLGLDEQVFYFTPKVGIGASKDLSFAVGALIVKIPDWDGDDSPTVGILYGVGTYGTTDASITGGLGYGFADDELADKPMVLFGAEFRMARRAAFVTENWVIPEVEDVVISYGFRFFGEALSVDLALVNVASSDAIFPGVPYVDFVFNF